MDASHRSRLFLIGLFASIAPFAVGACGANANARELSGGTTSGTGGATSGAGGSTMSSGGSNTTSVGSGGTGGTCPPPPPPSPTLPMTVGCYEGTSAGWVAIPCECELWLQNTKAGPASATITLDVTAPPLPELTGTEVDVSFEDPDGSWFATWAQDTGNGVAFALTSGSGKTTVRMGTSTVTLSPVPLAACETRKALGYISSVDTTTLLKMHATLDNGSVLFATADGTCINPPHP
jgi:hypothetical protein